MCSRGQDLGIFGVLPQQACWALLFSALFYCHLSRSLFALLLHCSKEEGPEGVEEIPAIY